MRRIGDLKRAAKAALRGNYGILIMALIVQTVLNSFGSSLTMSLFPGDSVLALALSQIFAIILSLVLSIVIAGSFYMHLKIARGESCTVGDLFCFFRKHPDRVIIASIVLVVIDMVATLPATYYNLVMMPYDAIEELMAAMPAVGGTMEELLEVVPVHVLKELAKWMTTYSIIVLLTGVFSMLLRIPFAMIYFIISDHDDMGGKQAVKASMRMMKGNFGRYLLLQLSFFPLQLISILAFYIPLLWVMPYMQMTSAMFYRDLLGEMNAPKAYTGINTAGAYSYIPEASEIPADPEIPDAKAGEELPEEDNSSEA